MRNKNDLEKQLDEINEYQDNVNNPGYYIGSGKIPPGSKRIWGNKIVKLIMGILLIIYSSIHLMDFSIATLLIYVLPLILGITFIFSVILSFKKNL